MQISPNRPVKALDRLSIHQNRTYRGGGYWILFFLLLAASGIFDDKGGNPIGLPYQIEITIILITAFAMIMTANSILKRKLKRTDLLLLFLIFSAWFLSATNSNVWHSQPFIYGLIEDRRVLMSLIYFPVVYLIRNHMIDQHDLVIAILAVAGIAILLSVILVSSGTINSDSAKNLESREGRLSIGAQLVIITTLFSYIFLLFKTNFQKYWTMWFVGSFGTLLLIVQTRKIILVITLLIIFYSLKKKSSFIYFLTTIILGGIMLTIYWPALSNQEFAIKFFAVWGQLFDESYLSSSARAQTIISIWTSLKETNFIWGKGAVSLLFEGGFPSIYGGNFYLADVGLAGMFYRYGVPVSLLFVWTSIFIAYTSIKKMNQMALKKATGIGFLFIFLSPGAGIFLYAGLMYGLLLSISVGFSKNSS